MHPGGFLYKQTQRRTLLQAMALALAAVFLISSCRSTTDLVLDDPVFFEDMVNGALKGDRFKITPEDYPGIRNLLKDEHPDYRLAGVILASQADDEELYPDIVDAALDENLDVSAAAKELIAENPEAFRPTIMNLLDTNNPSRRIGGLLLLSGLGGEDVVPVLIEYFNDFDSGVRNQASRSVYEVTDRNNPFLREALNSPDPMTASIAYKTLGLYADPDDAPVFIGAFSSENADIRREAQLAMLRLGDTGLPFLHILAADTSKPYRVRLAALEVIQGLRSTGSLELLLTLLDDKDERFREKAETILGTYGSEAVLDLSNLYRESVETNRNYAVRLLGEIGSASALPLLVSALNDSSPKVRREAMDSLRRFEEDAWPAMHDNLSDNAVILLMEGADPWLVTFDNGEPNQDALFLLITQSGRVELEDYLTRAGISKLKSETILSLEEAWHTADEFSELDRLIAEGRDPYLKLWRQRELNLVAARETLKQSFTELHRYFESRDPSDLDKAGVTRAESRRLENLARQQKAEIDRMDEALKAGGEARLNRYMAMRENLVRTWEYTLPSLRPLAREIYSEKGVDPDSLVNELALIE